jgi:uncharacterized ferredoxin-like protein
MVILLEDKLIIDGIQKVAELIVIAAKTAPKARGIDLIEVKIVTDKDIQRLSDRMKEIGDAEDNHTFKRDSQNIKQAMAIVILGTKFQRLQTKLCGYCGYKNCDDNEAHNGICAYNPGDLGIALGSAVSIAANHRVDNRIMYSVGYAAMQLGIMSPEIKIAYGIPLSVSGKNPFFDRK